MVLLGRRKQERMIEEIKIYSGPGEEVEGADVGRGHGKILRDWTGKVQQAIGVSHDVHLAG